MKIRALPWMYATVFCSILLGPYALAEPAVKLLPLKRVRLYEVGVGYFERSGALRDGSDLGLSLPQSQLDDALSSLVIVGGKGKARIADIEFESRESPGLARAEASLSDDPAAPLGFASVLRSFRGADVEVRQHGAAVRGRLVDVIALEQASAESCVTASARATDASAPTAPCTEVRDANLVVLNEDGTLARVSLRAVESVRALDHATAARLSRALDAVSHHSSATGRRILHVHGSGSAALTLGYIAEAPVFRASYRLVLDDHAQAGVIQGFALIHNDTDEAWRGVKLELVNGRPSSFLYPLGAPRYARRPLLTPEEALSTVPQLLGQTPDELWGDESGDSFAAGGLGLSGVGEGGGGRGEGIALGGATTVVHGAGASSALSVGDLSNLATATGVEGAAQFMYSVDAGIDLGAHGSALVPFVNEALTLTRVTWFDVGRDEEGGETAVRLINSSHQTLPAGVLSVFSEAGFSGSSLLPRTKPGETRVLRYGRDLDVTLQRGTPETHSEPQLYAFQHGALEEHSLRRSEISCFLSNKSAADRTVSAAFDIVANARVEGADEASFDTALARGVVSFRLPAGTTAARDLRIVEGIMTLHPMDQLSSQFLKDAAALKSIPEAQRVILARAGQELYLAEIRRGALPKRRADVAEALADATRLESHVRALGQASDEGHLAARRLRENEDRLVRLRRRVLALDSEALEHSALAQHLLARLGRATPLKIEHVLQTADDGERGGDSGGGADGEGAED